jgi:hypothetical protein
MILATDGELSFALFRYDNTNDFPPMSFRGFDAGWEGAALGLSLLPSNDDLIFRIDGMYKYREGSMV